MGYGLVHLFDGDGTLLVGDNRFASLETHLGLPDSLEPLQGPLDQDRSAPSGHAVNPEMDNSQRFRLARHGSEGQPKTWENSKKGPAIHKDPPSATHTCWHPHRVHRAGITPGRGPQQEVG